MPRANRYMLPAQVYHLTHRCHDRRFLFKFARDRNAYQLKLRAEALRAKISLLDFCLTSNHVHLLTWAEDPERISAFMQNVQGQTAQSYNRRKARSGAFWDDRYHATMIEPGGHLEKCLVYLALNMVRCRVVGHPREWRWCGYHELMGLRQRFRMLDLDRLLNALGGISASDFRCQYEALILEGLAKHELKRDPRWTESIAVGSEEFVCELAGRIERRQRLEIKGEGESWIVKEAAAPYVARGETEEQWR